jgi:hypothetical protein
MYRTIIFYVWFEFINITYCYATVSPSAFHFSWIDLMENFPTFWGHSSKCCLLSPSKNVVKSIWCFFRLKISLTLSRRDVVKIKYMASGRINFAYLLEFIKGGELMVLQRRLIFCVETEHLELSNCRQNWLQLLWRCAVATYWQVDCDCCRYFLSGNHQSSVEMKCMRRWSANSYSHPKELLSRGSWNDLKLLLRCATDRTHEDRNVFQSRAWNKFNLTISRIRNGAIKLLDDLSSPLCIPGKGPSRRYSS